MSIFVTTMRATFSAKLFGQAVINYSMTNVLTPIAYLPTLKKLTSSLESWHGYVDQFKTNIRGLNLNLWLNLRVNESCHTPPVEEVQRTLMCLYRVLNCKHTSLLPQIVNAIPHLTPETTFKTFRIYLHLVIFQLNHPDFSHNLHLSPTLTPY